MHEATIAPVTSVTEQKEGAKTRTRKPNNREGHKPG